MATQTLAEQRRHEIRRRYHLCRTHLLAADDAEARGLAGRAQQLRVYALLHWHAAEQEQLLLNQMIESQAPSVFRQANMFEDRRAA